MRLTRILSVCATMFLAAISALGQGDKSTVTSLEFQTPKNGMVQQYESGRRAKAAWHKEQKDPQMLFVLQVLTGEDTGSYVVGGAASTGPISTSQQFPMPPTKKSMAR